MDYVAIGWGITYLLRERFITGEIKDVLSDIDIKIQETEILNDDTLKDYHTYLMFRKEYNCDIPQSAHLILQYKTLRKRLGNPRCFGSAIYPLPLKGVLLSIVINRQRIRYSPVA